MLKCSDITTRNFTKNFPTVEGICKLGGMVRNYEKEVLEMGMTCLGKFGVNEKWEIKNIMVRI